MTSSSRTAVSRQDRLRPIPWRTRLGLLLACLMVAGTLVACADDGTSHPTPTPRDEFLVVTPTPGTPIPRTPTPRAQQTTYVVQPGDSLSGIAAKFGISQEELQQANHLDNPDSIYAGQELIIPAR